MITAVFSELLKECPDLSVLPAPDEWPWQQVAPLAHHHLLAPTLHRALRETGIERGVPVDAWRGLEHAVLQTHHLHALYGAVASELLAMLEGQAIRPVVLKGLGIARRFWKHPEDRPFRDLDLLFDAADRRKVELFFIRNGYRRASEGPVFEANEAKSEFELIRNPAVVVECHFGLGYGKFKIEANIANCGKHSTERGDDKLSFRCLGSEDEYLYLMYHCAVQHRFQKLGWLLDLALLRRSGAVDAAVVESRAAAAGMHEAMRMTDYFLGRFAGVPELAPPRVSRGLDRWFELIVDGSIEQSKWHKARLRARTHGGWARAVRYGLQRHQALQG